MNIVSKYQKWRNFRRTVSELSKLSNHELNDLGINRGEIQMVARKVN